MYSPLIESHPLRVHALASVYNWDGVAQASAMRCLDFDLTAPETIRDLRGISIENYSRLLSLARLRLRRFREMLNNPAGFSGSNPENICNTCHAPVHDLTWKILRMRLVDEFLTCPSGKNIKRELESWPEWTAVIGASHCSGTLYNALRTHTKIMQAITNLPTKLGAD